MRFTVEPAFWSLFPDARIGVVTVRGVDNTRRRCLRLPARGRDRYCRRAHR